MSSQSPGAAATTVATTSLPPITGTAASLLPPPSFTGGANSSDYTYANGTRLDCERYTTGADMASNNTCGAVASAYNVQLSDLLLWNPSLQTVSPCALDANSQYCVQRLEGIAANITDSCVYRAYALPGSTCNDMYTSWGLPVEIFTAWNPTTGPNCTTFLTGMFVYFLRYFLSSSSWLCILGYQYCVKVEHYKQPGIVSTCNQYAMANITTCKFLFLKDTLVLC